MLCPGWVSLQQLHTEACLFLWKHWSVAGGLWLVNIWTVRCGDGVVWWSEHSCPPLNWLGSACLAEGKQAAALLQQFNPTPAPGSCVRTLVHWREVAWPQQLLQQQKYKYRNINTEHDQLAWKSYIYLTWQLCFASKLCIMMMVLVKKMMGDLLLFCQR